MSISRIKSVLLPDDPRLADAPGRPHNGLVAVVEVVIDGLRSELLVPFEGEPGSTWDTWNTAMRAAKKAINAMQSEAFNW